MRRLLFSLSTLLVLSCTGTTLRYDPMSFIGTVGIRLLLPEHPFD